MKHLIVLCLLISAGLGLSSIPSWGPTSSIQCFQAQIYSGTLSASYSVNIPYSTYLNRTYSVSPRGFLSMAYIYLPSYIVLYGITAYTINPTYVTVTLEVDYFTYDARISVFLYTDDMYPTIQHYVNYTTGTISAVATATVFSNTCPYPSAINPNNSIIIVPYLTRIYQYYYCSGATVKANTLNSTTFQVFINILSPCNLASTSPVLATFLIIDRTKLQQSGRIFVDFYNFVPGDGSASTQWTTSYNKNQSATYIQAHCWNKMIGINSFWGSGTGNNAAGVSSCATALSAIQNSAMSSWNISVINFRYRLCDAGNKFYNLETNLCYDVCPDRKYGHPLNHNCLNCSYDCLTCSDDGLRCLTCSTADFRVLLNTTLVNFTRAGKCECKIGYYDDTLNNSACLPCHYTCLTCANSSITCIQCNGYRRLLPNFTCPCLVGFQDPTSSLINCTQKCGDGVKFVLNCDDGNNINGDGCSSSCLIETNYTCKQLSPSSPSICGYNKPLTFSVSSVIINNSTFTVIVNVNIVPVLPWMNTYNFSKLAINNSDVNITSSSYASGNLILNLKYSNNSDGQTIVFDFVPFNSSTTQYIPSSNFTIHIPALIAPPIIIPIPAYLATVGTLLIAMTIINLIVYFIGGFKLAYVQTMWTLQISYFCLLGSFVIQPLQQVFKIINVAANGYNVVVWNEINYNYASTNLQRFFYRDQFTANFNIMLIIQIIIIVFSLLFYGLSKVSKWKKSRKPLLFIFNFLLYDVTLSFSMFNIMNVSFAMGLQIIIFIQSGLKYLFYVNIIGMVLAFSVILTSVCLFIFRNNQFTNNIGMFKHDKVSRFHPLVMLGVRFMMGFIMGILFRHWYSGLIILAIQIGYGIYISVKNPYTLPFLLRAILNQGTILQNLIVGFLYKVYKINENDKGGLVPLWIQIFLLGVTCLSSLFYMLYTIYVKIKNIKSNKVSIQDDNGNNPSKKKRRVNLDTDYNATIQNINNHNDLMQISEIGMNQSKNKINKMRGQDY